MHSRILIAALLGLMSTLWIGCAQDVGDIDRTSPNKLDKAIFNDGGEWYMRQTVVGVPGTAMTSFIGLEANTNRVKFVIREDALVAHRVHEDVLGIDHSHPPYNDENLDAYQTPDDFVGAPVAAFSIRSHFDIQRQYNPATGEESNVITENGSDRYWTEQQYMRVDWSRNLINLDFDAMTEIASSSSLSWWQDGNRQDSPLYVECRNENGEWYDCDPDDLEEQKHIAYLEVTNSYVIKPDWIQCILNFGFPLYGGDCGPETITVRTSFVKIRPGDPEKYEPKPYDDKDMQLFGFFRTERCTYDRLYGCRDQTTIHLANRHNIWQDWKDENGNRLPYSQRTPKPIAYYLNQNFPIDLIDESLDFADEYSDIFKRIINTAGNDYQGRMFYLCANSEVQLDRLKVAKAKADGLDKNAAANTLSDPNHIDLFWDNTPAWDSHWLNPDYGYNSPDDVINALSQGYDDGVCIRREKPKRLGDIRYNFIAWVDNPQQTGPLGYGPSTTDPLTGETVTSNAYIYGAALDTYAQYTVDLIDLINGKIDPISYGYGENITQYIGDVAAHYGIPSDGVDQKSFREKMALAKMRRQNPDFMEKLTIDPSKLVREVDTYKNIWNRIKGSPLESMLLTEEVKVGLGGGLFGPNDPVDEEMLEALDPSALLLPPASRANGFSLNSNDYWKQFNRFSTRNMYMANFMDNNVLGLAIEFKEKYKDVQDDTERRLRIFYDLRGIIYHHVTEHEVGHTVGLRHNFEASYDALNYNPEYWKIRFDTDKAAGIPHTQPDRLFKLSDETDESGKPYITYDYERKIGEYKYSSTMDYGGKPNSQTHDLGLYDQAALAYAYADLVEVFNQKPHKIVVEYEAGPGYIDASDTTLVRSDEEISSWDDLEIAHVLDRNTHEVIQEDAFDQNMDFWNHSIIPALFTPDYDKPDAGNMDALYDRKWIPKDQYNPETDLRVPYRFCSDEYRGATPYCDVFDEGSDFNEIIYTSIQAYQAYYFHSSYRRGRAAWGLWLWPHLSRLYSRYFLPIAGLYQHWLLRASQWGTAYSTNPYAGANQQVGIEDGLRLLLGVIAQPHPGTYRWSEDESMYLNLTSTPGYRCSDYDSVCEDFEGAGNEDDYLDLEPGNMVRWRYSRFDFDSGYYYYLRYQILSSLWDRLAAIWALTTPEVDIIGVDTNSNMTGYMIPYYLLYDYELSRFFGGVMTESFDKFAPVIKIGEEDKGFQMQDPLANWQTLNDYGDPTLYRIINPYPSSYGHSSFTDRLYTMAYSLAFFQVLYDQSFNHACSIFVVGNGEGWTFADTDGDGVYDIQEGMEDSDGDDIPAYLDPDEITPENERTDLPKIQAYTDPFTYKTYMAVDYRDRDYYGRRHFVPALAMLEKANALKAKYNETHDFYVKRDLQQVREEIELLMMTNQLFANINAPWWISPPP